jgi:hypothetical protein
VVHHAERVTGIVAGFVAVFAMAGCGSAHAQPAERDRVVFESTLFLSPDGNIACNIGMDEGVRCDIIDADWPQQPEPADCQESYGHMIAINPWTGLGKPAEFICAGDTVFGSDEPLADGDSITSGEFRCESVDPSITCRNTETGHGFSISRDAYQLF